MPIYCETYQLVVPKEHLGKKYKSGESKFKADFNWNAERDHEDNELVSVCSHANSFAVPEGLHYDTNTKSSRDFVIVARYADNPFSWPVSWCETDRVYIWHKDCSLSSYREAQNRASTPMDKLVSESEKTGKALFPDIL